MVKRSSTAHPKRPRDINALASQIVGDATAEDEDTAEDKSGQESEPAKEDDGKNPAAVALGRLGGKKGGKARAAKLTPERRSEIARLAASARWKKSKS